MRGWDDDSKEHKFASLGTVTPRFLLARSPVSEPRSVRQDPGPPPGQETRGWEDRRSRGLSRQRRSGGALRQRTDATQRRAIRPARPFLRLFHIRQSFLLQRLVPSGWRSRRSSVPRPRAGGRNRRHGGSAGRAPRSRKRQERSAKADQRAGATGPGFGHYARTRQRKRPDQHPVRSDYRRRCLPSPPHRGYAARRHHQGGRTPAALHHCRKQVPFKTLSHGPGGDSCPRLSGRGQLGSSGGVSCDETVTPCPNRFSQRPQGTSSSLYSLNRGALLPWTAGGAVAPWFVAQAGLSTTLSISRALPTKAATATSAARETSSTGSSVSGSTISK